MSSSSPRRVGWPWMDLGGSGRALPVRSVLRLQQTIGNREVIRLLEEPPPDPAPTVVPVEAAPTRARPTGWLATAWRRLIGRQA